MARRRHLLSRSLFCILIFWVRSSALAVGIPQEVNVGFAPMHAQIPGVGLDGFVDVSIGPVTDLRTGALSFTYDPAIVTATAGQFVSELMGSPSGLSGCSGQVDLTPGRVTISFTCPTPAQSGGLVAVITFHGVAKGISSLSFSDTPTIPFGCLLNDPCSQPPRTCTELDCITMDGSIAVLGGTALTATPTVTATQTRTSTATTAASPTATHTPNSPPTPTNSSTPMPSSTPTASTAPSTATPTNARTPTNAVLPSATTTIPPAATETATATHTVAETPTHTPAPTATNTANATTTDAPTATRTPTATAILQPTVSPTPTPSGKLCVGDCKGDGQVTVNELIAMVNIALGTAPLSTCTAGDANGDGEITINEIIAGVNNALNGCSA